MVGRVLAVDGIELSPVLEFEVCAGPAPHTSVISIQRTWESLICYITKDT